MDNALLRYLATNPHGWGNGPSLDPAYDAPVQPGDETWRAGMFPLRTVAGDTGERDRMEFATPALFGETWDALRTPGDLMNGIGKTPEQISHSASTLAGMMMGGGGLVAGPAEANALASGLRGARETTPIRAYHWSPQAADISPENKFLPLSHFGTPETSNALYETKQANLKPEYKGKIAEDWRNTYGDDGHGATVPVDLDIKNPLRIQDFYRHDPAVTAKLIEASEALGPDNLQRIYALDRFAGPLSKKVLAAETPDAGASIIDSHLKSKGYDGLVYNNRYEGGGDSYIATRPGSVRSATTGETLFSNGSREGAGAGAVNALAENQPIRAYHGTSSEFEKFKSGTNYFAKSPQQASIYAGDMDGARMLPVDVTARIFDPLTPANFESFNEAVKTGAVRPDQYYNHTPDSLDMLLHRNIDGVSSWLKENGYGGFVGREGGYEHMGVFQPNTVRSATTGETLFSNGSREGAGAGAVNALANESKPGITAYHGSPHDFDKFSLDHIGKGEGAQAYGHGLYFAENEGVAKSYRDTLGDYTNSVKWKGEQPPTPQQQSILNKLGGADARSSTAMTVDMLKREMAMMIRDAEHGMFPDEKRAAQYRADYQELERIAPLIETTPPGRMYQVRINADPEDFLDWDKPLSQRSEHELQALSKIPEFSKTIDDLRFIRKMKDFRSLDDTSRAKLDASIKAMDDTLHRNKIDLALKNITNTERLREAGIPGIRYLDQGSRTAGEGSSNYVVFDDALIDILKKYSNGSPLGSGVGMSNALMPYQDQASDPTTADILQRYRF